MIAHNNVQVRMVEAKIASDMVPADTFLEKRRRKYHNGELIEIFYMPNAITDGDSIVQFRKSDVIATVTSSIRHGIPSSTSRTAAPSTASWRR